MTPIQPDPAASAPAVVNPLQWQVGTRPGPDGRPVCQLTVAQGQLQAAVVLTPDDLRNLGEQLLACARQAATGLIVPSGPVIRGLNGH